MLLKLNTVKFDFLDVVLNKGNPRSRPQVRALHLKYIGDPLGPDIYSPIGYRMLNSSRVSTLFEGMKSLVHILVL